MTRTLFATAAVALPLLVARPMASAQPEPVPPAETEGSGAAAAEQPVGDVVFVVEVRRRTDDGGFEPIADQPVRAHVIAPPHDVIRTETSRTDADGVARFRIEAAPGREVVADLEVDKRYFTDPLDLSEPGEHRVSVDVVGNTSDPSVVRAHSVHTILEPWEGYVTVTQAWNLTTRDGEIYQAAVGPDGRPDLASLLRIPLPEDAEGVNVVRPAGNARVSGTTLSTTMEVRPREGERHRGSDIVIQFSIPTHDKPHVAWDQTIGMEVDSFGVIIPLESSLSRHPRLDVDLILPECDDPSVACLTMETDPGELPLREQVDVVMATGSVSPGQTVEIATTGWPAPNRWERPAAAAAIVLAVLAALGLIFREVRRPRGDPRAMRQVALEQQREALLQAAAELDARLDDGLIVERDHEIAMERIRQQLGVVYRRTRELDAGEENVAAG